MSKVISMQHAAEVSPKSPESLASLVMGVLQDSAGSFTRNPGETLFVEGQSPREVVLLLEGYVKLSMDSPDGGRQILRIAGPEEVLGLSSALTGKAHETTAETLTICVMARVPFSDFDCVLRTDARALRQAAMELSAQYSNACEHVQMLGGTPSVSARLARVLLRWSETGRKSERGLYFRVPLDHGEIGEFIGARRDTVTRLFGEFQRRGMVDVRGSLLTITDPMRLEACAGFPELDWDEPA